MRRLEINVPDALLTEVAHIIHDADYIFAVHPTAEKKVMKVEIAYDKGDEGDVGAIEDEINETVENYYEKEDEDR